MIEIKKLNLTKIIETALKPISETPIPKQIKVVGYSVAALSTQFDAIIGKIFNPEVSYFNIEHILVGAGFGLLLSGTTYIASNYSAWRIEEQEKTRETLKTSEENLKSILNSMSEGLCLHEIIYEEGKPVNYRILDTNPAYGEILNVDTKKAIGMLATEFYQVELAPFLEIYAKVAESGEPVAFENYVRSMNRYFLISAFSPKKGQFVTLFEDVTKRKEAEEELENRTEDLQAANMYLEEQSKENIELAIELDAANKKLTQTNDRLTETLYQLAHDMKNPIGSIMSSSEIIALNNHKLQDIIDEKHNELLDENSEFAELITGASNKLITFIDTMLTTSKHIVPTYSNEDLYMLINDVISGQQITANERNLEIVSYVPENTRVYVDPNLLQTAMTNLISNSLKFTSEGGVYLDLVSDNDKYIKTNNASKKSYITLSIRDTGVGMPEDKLADFLTEGKQASPSIDSRDTIGTGIGNIAIKNSIYKIHGFFDGTSEIGKGVTWYVTVPSIK